MRRDGRTWSQKIVVRVTATCLADDEIGAIKAILAWYRVVAPRIVLACRMCTFLPSSSPPWLECVGEIYLQGKFSCW